MGVPQGEEVRSYSCHTSPLSSWMSSSHLNENTFALFYSAFRDKRLCGTRSSASVQAVLRMHTEIAWVSKQMLTWGWLCRLLELASATQMWVLLFTGRQSWPFTQQWCEFLDEKHARPINHDTWKQLLQFKKVCHPETDVPFLCYDSSFELWCLSNRFESCQF